MRRAIPLLPPGFRRGFSFGLAGVVACLAGQASAGVVDARRVVDTSTAVPGGPFEPGSSVTFTTLFSGSAAEGRLVFAGWVQDEFGIILGEGLYSVDVGGGEPQIIADTRTCADDPCPPDNLFTAFGDIFSFDGTTVGFDANWNTRSGPVGVWTARGAVLNLVVRDGDPNPSGGSFDIFGSPAVDGGEIAFVERSFIAERGIFAAPTSGGDARIVADGSTAAPGGGGTLFDPSSLFRVAYRDGFL